MLKKSKIDKKDLFLVRLEVQKTALLYFSPWYGNTEITTQSE